MEIFSHSRAEASRRRRVFEPEWTDPKRKWLLAARREENGGDQAPALSASPLDTRHFALSALSAWSHPATAAMNLYRKNHALSIVGHGPCDEERALAELKSFFDAGLQTYASGEDALEKSTFGLSRSEEDFLEASCTGHSVDFYSDRLVIPAGLASLFAGKKHFWISVGRVQAEEVIRDYFRLPRSVFRGAAEWFRGGTCLGWFAPYPTIR